MNNSTFDRTTCDATPGGRGWHRKCGEPAVVLLGTARVPYCEQCARGFLNTLNSKMLESIERRALDGTIR